jgi:hypothetical protein
MSDEEYSTFEAKAEILRTGSDVMERQERESYEGCEYEVAGTAYLKRRAADLEGMRSQAQSIAKSPPLTRAPSKA